MPSRSRVGTGAVGGEVAGRAVVAVVDGVVVVVTMVVVVVDATITLLSAI
jgi:hypothetical protein